MKPILPLEPSAALMALNNAHATELSWLGPDRFHALIASAFRATRIDTEAFLLAFDQEAPYDSPNFLWFRDRFPRFIYVDRVVVAPEARGQGHARRLYEDLIARARAVDQSRIVCEINSEPPNPASDAFHATLGFAPVGTAKLPSGKQVTYFARETLTGAMP